MDNLYTWFSTDCISVTLQKNDDEEINRYRKKYLIDTYKGVQLSFMSKEELEFSEENCDYFFINAKYEYRPDLISYNVYGSPLYYWAILAANNMKSFWELKCNMTIKVPDIMSVLER